MAPESLPERSWDPPGAKKKVLELPGAPRENFGAKNRYINVMEAKSAQKPAPGVQKSLPERSWEPPGPKKNFGNFQKRPRIISSDFTA